MGAALSSPWRASSSALSIGVVYYLYNIHYGKRKRPGGEFPTKPPKISNIPKLGRSLDKVIFMYAATSILGVLTVMLSPLMVSLG